MRIIHRLALMVAAVLLNTVAVDAGVIIFTDRPSFDAAITPSQSIDFESLAPGLQPQPLVIGDASFFSTDGTGLFNTTGFGAPTRYLSSQFTGAIRIEIAPGTTGIGLDVGSLLGPTSGFTYELRDATSIISSGSFLAANDNSTFLGFTSDMGDIRQLIITGPTEPSNTFEAIDNVTLGNINPIPEPASIVLASIALLLVGVGGAAARSGRQDITTPKCFVSK